MSEDGKKEIWKTRTCLDHAGLELMLRDVESAVWRRNLLRDLVAWLASCKSDKADDLELVEGLETWEAIDAAWAPLVRRWL